MTGAGALQPREVTPRASDPSQRRAAGSHEHAQAGARCPPV